MLTSLKNTSLVILSHSDDEIFLIPYLLGNRDKTYVFIYLVNDYPKRSWLENYFNRETELQKSMSLLSRYCSIRHIQVPSSELNLRDGNLYNEDSTSLIRLLGFIQNFNGFTEVLSLEYEGGHQDHDFSWFLSRKIASVAKVPHLTFSGYRQTFTKSRIPFFSVMKPRQLSIKKTLDRFQCTKVVLHLITIYRSQLQTWIPLLLPTIFALSKGHYFISENSRLDLNQRYLYDIRGKAQYQEVVEKMVELFGVETC